MATDPAVIPERVVEALDMKLDRDVPVELLRAGLAAALDALMDDEFVTARDHASGALVRVRRSDVLAAVLLAARE